MNKNHRYLKKIETFEKEREFIKEHTMEDGTSERALLYALQICVEITTDCVAMKVKDVGLVVEDDYKNIEKLVKEGVIEDNDGVVLKQFNGIRNAVVHKYDHLNLDIIEEALSQIDDLSEALYKVVE